jgi:peptide/nickel transport system substrate-binding protein
LSGQADLYDNIQPSIVPRVDSSRTVRVVPYPPFGYAYLGFNLRDPKRAGAPHPIFGDRRVRRAISMAVDREAMLRNVFDTLGVLGVGPYPRYLADTSVKVLPFDRAHAAALLDSAGWIAGADAQRSKSGRPLAFSILVPTSSTYRMRYAVLIQEQLKSIGARADIESMDIQAFLARQNARNFDTFIQTWQPDPNIGGVKEVWASEGMTKGGQNLISYSSPAFDALIDSASITFDPARSKRYSHRAYEILVQDAPAIFLYDIPAIAGIHRRIRPTDMRATGWWYDIADWSIPPNERIDRDRVGLRPAQP